MEKNVFYGDLYIKWAPTRVVRFEFDKEENESIIDHKGKNLEMEELIQCLTSLIENFDEIIETKNPTTINSVDYSTNIGFYYLTIENGIVKFTSEALKNDCLMTNQDGTNCSIRKINDYCEFDTMEEAKNHFISLSDFLLNASYKGLMFEPIKEGLDKIVVLYEYKDTYLVISEHGVYNVISKHHPIMNDYKASNIVFDEMDRKSCYIDLYHQKFTRGIGR